MKMQAHADKKCSKSRVEVSRVEEGRVGKGTSKSTSKSHIKSRTTTTWTEVILMEVRLFQTAQTMLRRSGKQSTLLQCIRRSVQRSPIATGVWWWCVVVCGVWCMWCVWCVVSTSYMAKVKLEFGFCDSSFSFLLGFI